LQVYFFGFKIMKKNFGFTLIELLVVMAIISLLSSVVMSQLNEARAKARDAVRIEHLQEIRRALEVYRIDSATGQYPVRNVSSNNPSQWALLAADLNPYIKLSGVIDPKQGPAGSSWPASTGDGVYNYYYGSNGGTGSDDYNLVARLEIDGPNDCQTKNYRVNISGFPTGFTKGASWCPGGGSDVRARLYSDH
jgi:general secretion pathway protein G